MRRMPEVLGLLVLVGILSGGRSSVTAQNPSPTTEALVEEIVRLKKQLLAEQKRAEQLAAEARAQAELALQNEQKAREEAARAREALEKLPQQQPKPGAEVERLKQELAEMAKSLQASKDLNVRLATELQRLQTVAEVEKAVYTERLKVLEQRFLELEKHLRGREENSPPRGKNPPAAKVEGQVSKVEGKLLLLSIGQDAGLARGHTLELFRLTPGPTYLGTIRIVEVKPKEALAEPVNRLKEEPRVGDRAASQIP